MSKLERKKKVYFYKIKACDLKKSVVQKRLLSFWLKENGLQILVLIDYVDGTALIQRWKRQPFFIYKNTSKWGQPFLRNVTLQVPRKRM